MKNLFKIGFLTFAIVIIASSLSFAKYKPFQGIITYSISYPGSDLDTQTLSMMPKTATMIIKDEMFKLKINMMGGAQSTVFNLKDKTGFVLIDVMGQKYAIRQDAQKYEDELTNTETEVTITNNTKKIAGYVCKEALLQVNDKESGEKYDMKVYFTDEIEMPYQNSSNPVFKDIPGVMLQFDVHNDKMNMQFSAINVKKMKVSDEQFEFPKGYTITTKEELQKMLGG